jgi:hypothetical protein
MTSDDSLPLILRRLDEIERKLDRITEELQTPRPSAIQHVGAIFQGRTDGPEEQIFGVNQQIPGRGQTYLSDMSLKVIWVKQRTSTFSHHRRVKN